MSKLGLGWVTAVNRRLQVLFVASVLFCFCSPLALSQAGTRTLSRSLDQLVDEAATIVRGQVLSTSMQPHPQFSNLTTVVVTMRIADTYKGSPQKLLTFRQFVWDQNPQHGSVGYSKGEELILFLRPVSQYGLTSPAGLEQGRFRVVSQGKNGQKTVVNGRGNVGLFDHLQQRAQARGVQLSSRSTRLIQAPGRPLVVEDFESLIRALARSN